MNTNVILTNKTRSHAHMHNLTIPTQNKKPGIGASYAIRTGNGVGLLYTPGPHGSHRARTLKLHMMIMIVMEVVGDKYSTVLTVSTLNARDCS